jgi:WD40 repeat protein
LGAQVADALHYAHRQGVIHRDIKPSNLLLDAQGNVWVTDFGLAKLLEGDDLSQSRDLVGTLRFMAPERFRGATSPLGDLYSLGATLYELLTLKPAFAEHDQARLIDQITHEPPAPLRQHDPRIPRDLETLVQKAMAKAPDDRFATAGELAEELRRFLESRPIRSRPTPAHERFWRWCRRNPGLATANIAAATLTTVLAITMSIAAWIFYHQRDQISRDRGDLQVADRQTRENLFDSLVAQAQARRFSRRVGQRFDSLAALEKAAEIGRELELSPDRFDPLRDEAIACMALPDMRKTGRVIDRPSRVVLVAFDPTMTRYALRFRDGMIQVKNVDDDREVARFQARGDREIFVFDFSPDGRYLATTHFPGFALTVWDIDRAAVVLEDPGPVSWAAAKFSPDSRRIALCHQDGALLIYDLATGRPSRRSSPPGANDLAFRGDGARIAITYGDPKDTSCRILEADTGRVVRSFPLPVVGGVSVAWSPDGTTLATPCGDMKIYLWEADSGKRRSVLEGSTNGGLIAAFHPSGTLLASNGWEGRLRLWDAVLFRPVLSLTAVLRSHIAFSHDGRIVISLEDKLTTYKVDPALEYRSLALATDPPNGLQRASIRRDGRLLAVGSDRGVLLWDLARGTELAFPPIGYAWHLKFETTGDLITNGSLGVRRWPVRLDADRGEFRIGPPAQLALPGRPGEIAEDRSGRVVALANFGEARVLTPERAFSIGPLDDSRSVAVSPDGQWLATGSFFRGAQVWRVRDSARVADLSADDGSGVMFSPDGKWLMTTNPPCRLWAVGKWLEARRPIGGTGFGFSPDSRMVVVQDASRAIRLVVTESGRTLARLDSPDSCGVAWATFSPDGSRLVVTTNEGPAVHIWELRAIRRKLVEMGLDWDAPAFPDDDPASPSVPPLPPLKVDLGPPAGAKSNTSSDLPKP